MDHEVGQLVNAFRGELEACHAYLDAAGVPRRIGTRALTLKDRIAVLVEADELAAREAGNLRVEVEALRIQIEDLKGRRRSRR